MKYLEASGILWCFIGCPTYYYNLLGELCFNIKIFVKKRKNIIYIFNHGKDRVTCCKKR